MRQFIFPLMLAVLLAIGLVLLVTAPETEVATVPAPPSSMTLEPVEPEPLRPEPLPSAPLGSDLASNAPIDTTTLDAAPLDPARLDPQRIETPPGRASAAPAEDAAAEGSVDTAMQTEDPAPSSETASGDPVEAPAVEGGIDAQSDAAVDGLSGDEATVEPGTGVQTSAVEAADEAARVRPATVAEPDPEQTGAETAAEQDHSGAVSELVATGPLMAAPEPAIDGETGAGTDASEPNADTLPESESAAEPAAAAPGSVAEVVSDPAFGLAPDPAPDAAPAATMVPQIPPLAASTPPEPLPSLEVLLTEDGFDPEALTRYVRQSTLGARQKAALSEAIAKAQGPAAQAQLVEQLRASLGL